MDPPTSMIGEGSYSMKRMSENVIQEQYDSIKGSVALCSNIEHLQGKNRTGERLVDSTKTKTKAVTVHQF